MSKRTDHEKIYTDTGHFFHNGLYLVYFTCMNMQIAIIGGGAMGGTLAQAIIKADTGYRLIVCDRDTDKLKNITASHAEVETTTDPVLCASADIVFLAVKPQDFASIIINFKEDTLLCSIMAGVSIESLRRFGTSKIVRMMPNTSAQVGVGFTAWTTTDVVTQSEKKFLEKILSCMGKHLYVEQEDDINKATAISGSGPAYFFTMLLAFIDAAQSIGFSEKDATAMAIQTMKGVSALVDEESDLHQLVQRVASKGGTTEAALAIFKESKIDKIWQVAIRAAYERAKELSR